MRKITVISFWFVLMVRLVSAPDLVGERLKNIQSGNFR